MNKMRFPFRITIFRARTGNEKGFTLPEIVVAVLITTLLASAVGAVVLGAFTLTTQSQLVGVNSSQAQQVLTNFQTEVRGAARIVGTATADSVSYDFQRGSVCERHVYTFKIVGGVRQLEHKTRAVDLTSTENNCVSAIPSFAAANEQTVVEMNNLGSASRFYYYNEGGNEVSPPISETPCPTLPSPYVSYGYVNVPTVEIVIAPPTVSLSTNQVRQQIDQTRATVRSYTLGLQCQYK